MLSLLCVFVLVCASASATLRNGKRGLAVVDDLDISQANTTKTAISWQYSWEASPPRTLADSGFEFVPMQWGEANIANFAKKVKTQGAHVILGFNEPDLQGQANMDPNRAAVLWKKYINPLSTSGVRLGSPSITNSPTGLQWLSNFLSACTGCKIDFLSIHWYGSNVGSFYDYIWQMHGRFPHWPLWVTEYASTSSDAAEVVDFLNSTTHYMDTIPWIERYAWFAYFKADGTSQYSLLDANGHPNALGNIYLYG